MSTREAGITREARAPRPAGPALDSVTRTMALALGVGSAAFLLLSLPSIPGQASSFGVPWTVAATVGMFGPMIVAAVLSPWIPPRVVRLLAGIGAVAQLLVLITLVPVLPGGVMPEEAGTPWPVGATLVGTASAAVAWPARITWPYLGVSALLVGVDRVLASERPIPDLATQDVLHALLFTSIFTALALAIRRAGEQLDVAADLAVAETRRVTTADARRRERGRIEALVHDSLLVALLASARGSDRAAAQAAEALERLDALESGDDAMPRETRVDPQAWLWRVQAVTTQLAPAARFSHEEHEPGPVPADVGDALLEASAEALRNSVKHAGAAARAVHVRLAAGRLEVTVIDDGRGFDPAAVDEARLGLAVSIRGRMRELPGGDAAIVSRPGLGTRVVLSWSAT